VPLEGLHKDRDRAESFGLSPVQYDRLRPAYPEALIDDLVSLEASAVLDVGCGTGKVARALIDRGLRVLGVEPDEAMAAIARRHGVPVDLATFEAWDRAGRAFDLLTAGHAWHWVDPGIGLRKASSVVNPGGTVALFWNYHAVEAPMLKTLERVYAACAPELEIIGRDPTGSPDSDPFMGSDRFTPGESRTYRWTRELSANEWVAMLATFSDHQRQGKDRLLNLQDTMRAAIDTSGGTVRSQCGTYVWSARRSRTGHTSDPPGRVASRLDLHVRTSVDCGGSGGSRS
jgi:SAM-dependent methyltransferase